jgi:hypothetical protein
MSVISPRGRILCGLLVALVALCGLLAGVSSAEAKLVFKRTNGSVIDFKGTPKVWCGPWDEHSSRRSIRVELLAPRRAWLLRAVQGDVASGRRIKFPTSINYDKPEDALLFVAQRKPLIEASTNEEEASGWMAFSQSSCELGGVVEFTIHAILDSELFEGTRVRVNGTFSGQVGEAPPTPIPADSAK